MAHPNFFGLVSVIRNDVTVFFGTNPCGNDKFVAIIYAVVIPDLQKNHSRGFLKKQRFPRERKIFIFDPEFSRLIDAQLIAASGGHHPVLLDRGSCMEHISQWKGNLSLRVSGRQAGQRRARDLAGCLRSNEGSPNRQTIDTVHRG
jgi:hypothetical protein